MRFREDNPSDLDRARVLVSEWRDRNPQGTADQMVAELGGGFHKDYGPVLRAVLFADGQRRARRVTGVTPDARDTR